jgi:hypothetical protein
MSQITGGKLRIPFGSTCQMPQQIKCICIQVDCRIHSEVPEPNEARFGRPLIVECLFNCQARLHQLKAKSNSAILIDLPTSQRKAKIYFYSGSSQNESSCASLLAAHAKSQSEVQRHVKFIVELVSEGARNAPTIFQTFSSTVAFSSGAQSARASPLPVVANQTNATTRNSPKKRVHG